MGDQTAEILLAEIREFRRHVQAWHQEMGERVATAEAQLKSLVGNGQPGRVALLETDVTKLQQLRWWLVGAAAGISGLSTLIGWWVVSSRH